MQIRIYSKYLELIIENVYENADNIFRFSLAFDIENSFEAHLNGIHIKPIFRVSISTKVDEHVRIMCSYVSVWLLGAWKTSSFNYERFVLNQIENMLNIHTLSPLPSFEMCATAYATQYNAHFVPATYQLKYMHMRRKNAV